MQFLMDVIVEVKKHSFGNLTALVIQINLMLSIMTTEMTIFLEATEGTDLAQNPMVKKFAKDCFDKFS
jgi:hypothetical protein